MIRLEARPKKENVTLIHCAHADIDVPGDAGAEALAAVIAKVKAYTPEPTDIICTGGGVQCYWYLDTPLAGSQENIAKIQSVSKALADALGGDHCQDVAHLMRVPFTVNHPNKLKRSKGRVPVASYVIGVNHDVDLSLYSLDDLPLAAAETKRESNDNTDPLSYAGIGSPEITGPG